MNGKPKQEQFELSKVRFDSKKGVTEIEAKVTFSDPNGDYIAELKDKYPITPHPDLTDLFDMAKPWLAQVHGLLDGKAIIESSLFDATPAQEKVIEEFYNRKLDLIRVTGIKLTGSDGNRGALITGTYNGMAINTRPIKFSSSILGFEEDLEGVCATLVDEAYEFCFMNKKAVQELVFGEGDDLEESADEKNEPELDFEKVADLEEENEELPSMEVAD